MDAHFSVCGCRCGCKERLQVQKRVKVRYRDAQAAAIAGQEAGRGPESINGRYLAADLEVVKLQVQEPTLHPAIRWPFSWPT